MIKKHIRVELHSDAEKVVCTLFNLFQWILVFILCIHTEGKQGRFIGCLKVRVCAEM